MGTVYGYVQFASVNLNVIAHISQFLYYAGVSFCKYVFVIVAGFIIKIIYGSFVAAHIAFVQKVESGYFILFSARGNRLHFWRDNHLLLSA